MWNLTIKVYNRRYEGDNSFYYETIRVSETQLRNWLNRGNTHSTEIVRYWK